MNIYAPTFTLPRPQGKVPPLLCLVPKVRYPHYSALIPKVRYPHYSALAPKGRYPHYSALAPKVRYLHYSGARVRMVPIVPTLAEHFPGSLECIFLWGRSGWHLDRATLPILCPLRMPGCAILR